MPAYVSVSLSQTEPEALAWRHQTWNLPQCPVMRPASAQRAAEFAAKYPDPGRYHLDPLNEQCGHQKFHSGDHGMWRIASQA
jgi:hypothetical protein